MKQRCLWATSDPDYIAYHDLEWGVPVHDDRTHFEFLILDGAQAGLSWLTILKKRENYRRAFDHFDPQIVARYNQDKVEALILDKGIVRNRKKIESVPANARAFLEIQKEFGTFDTYIWSFVNGVTIKNAWQDLSQVPAETGESKAMSRDLKKRGFKFVGPTICYGYMQAAGLVNDHLTGCFRYGEV